MKPAMKGRGARYLWRALPQACFLFLVWLIFSGKFDWFHVGTGVLAVFLILWLDRKLGAANLGEERVPTHPHWGRLCLYVPWLAWQMLVSSWHVGRLVLSPRMHETLNPKVISFRSGQPHAIAKVALGNSITLTPATLTLHIDDDRFLIHALTDQSMQSLLDGAMQRKVAWVFHCDLDEPVKDAEVLTQRVRL